MGRIYEERGGREDRRWFWSLHGILGTGAASEWPNARVGSLERPVSHTRKRNRRLSFDKSSPALPDRR
jgi:hypothetical protein